MSDLKMCSCNSCKRGRSAKFNQRIIKSRRNAHNRKIKNLLRTGQYDKIESRIAIPYTD